MSNTITYYHGAYNEAWNPTLGVYLTNLGAYNEGLLRGEWVEFPMEPEEFQEARKRIGIGEERPGGGEYEELFVSDYDSRISGIAELGGEFPDYNKLNQIASDFEDLDPGDQDKVNAILESSDGPSDLNELGNLLQGDPDLNKVELVEGGRDDETYGEYLVDQIGGVEELGDDIRSRYFNAEAFGRDIKLEGNGEDIGDDYVRTDEVSRNGSPADLDPGNELPQTLNEEQLETLRKDYNRTEDHDRPGKQPHAYVPELEVTLVNQNQPDETGPRNQITVDLPISQEDYFQALKNIGIGEPGPDGTPLNQVGIADIDSPWIPMPVSMDDPDLSTLNQIAEDYSSLDQRDRDSLDLLGQSDARPGNWNELANVIHGPNPEVRYLVVYPGGADDRELGAQLAEEGLWAEVQNEYFDYEAFGREAKLEESGGNLGDDYLNFGCNFSLNPSEPNINVDLWERDDDPPELHLGEAMKRGQKIEPIEYNKNGRREQS